MSKYVSRVLWGYLLSCSCSVVTKMSLLFLLTETISSWKLLISLSVSKWAKKIPRVQSYFNAFSQKSFVQTIKIPHFQMGAGGKKSTTKKIFWLWFPDNDLCIPYPWMISLSSVVLSVVIIGVISNQNSRGSYGTV